MGPTQRPLKCSRLQEGCASGCLPRPRRRLCLLKRCERPFEPSRPQTRYCSADCRSAARQWRCWRASRTYRASEEGQVRRREQSRRYRERLKARLEPEEPAADSREGQRPARLFKGFCCARLGCYELFPRYCRSPLQNFCGPLCRKALRRVRQREARWHQRLGEPRDTCSAGPLAVRGSPFP